MTRIKASRKIEASHDRVWEVISDLDSHPLWMRDARSVEFISTRRRGVGTRMEVETRVGPLRTVDVIEIVGWDEGRTIEVDHQGLVTGRGALAVGPADSGTLVTWSEDLRFPWWLGGGLTTWLARPVLTRMWAGNLKRLDELVSSP